MAPSFFDAAIRRVLNSVTYEVQFFLPFELSTFQICKLDNATPWHNTGTNSFLEKRATHFVRKTYLDSPCIAKITGRLQNGNYSVMLFFEGKDFCHILKRENHLLE